MGGGQGFTGSRPGASTSGLRVTASADHCQLPIAHMGNVALTLAELGRWTVVEGLQEQVVRANAKIGEHTLSTRNVEAGRRARNAKSRQKDRDLRQEPS